VGVHLRRAKALVSEQLLDHAKICTAVEEVRGERVAQRMRVKRLRKASRTCNVVKSCASTALAERSTVAIQEERRD
jgi:hypothetical protein